MQCGCCYYHQCDYQSFLPSKDFAHRVTCHLPLQKHNLHQTRRHSRYKQERHVVFLRQEPSSVVARGEVSMRRTLVANVQFQLLTDVSSVRER